jgi:hypothetical protein
MPELPAPLPERPDFSPPAPRGSCLVWFGVLVAFLLSALLAVLMIGFLWPLVIGFTIFAVIALQYLVWGWWFERIYRSAPDEPDSFRGPPGDR